MYVVCAKFFVVINEFMMTEINQVDRVSEEIISFMESHPLFARKQITSLGMLGDVKFKIMWEQLSDKLNALGVFKSVEQWQEVRSRD